MVRALLVVALALAAAGCGDDLTPDGDAVRSMVLETCAPGGDPAADGVCRCAYDGLLERFGSDELARFDELLRNDPAALPPDARRIVLDCTYAAVAPPTQPPPPNTTTTSTATDATTTTG